MHGTRSSGKREGQDTSRKEDGDNAAASTRRNETKQYESHFFSLNESAIAQDLGDVSAGQQQSHSAVTSTPERAQTSTSVKKKNKTKHLEAEKAAQNQMMLLAVQTPAGESEDEEEEVAPRETAQPVSSRFLMKHADVTELFYQQKLMYLSRDLEEKEKEVLWYKAQNKDLQNHLRAAEQRKITVAQELEVCYTDLEKSQESRKTKEEENSSLLIQLQQQLMEKEAVERNLVEEVTSLREQLNNLLKAWNVMNDAMQLAGGIFNLSNRGASTSRSQTGGEGPALLLVQRAPGEGDATAAPVSSTADKATPAKATPAKATPVSSIASKATPASSTAATATSSKASGSGDKETGSGDKETGSGDKKYSCPVCDSKFHTYKQMYNHKEQHRNLTCKNCSFITKRVFSFNRHVLTCKGKK